MNNFTAQHCIPCEGGIAPLTRTDAEETMKHVPGWTLSLDGGKIMRSFTFADFAEAMIFVNKVAVIAEHEGHHPDIEISWNNVQLTLTTHAINGLSTNDFIVAAQCNAI